MVSASPADADLPPAASTGPAAARSRLTAAAARFLDCLPALALALLCLRGAELLSASQVGGRGVALPALAVGAIGVDFVNLVRYLPLLFLYSLPFLLIRSRRGRFWGLGLAWSALLLLQAALVQYFLIARAPLGADLFAYSGNDLRNTVSGGIGLHGSVVVGAVMALTALWLLLFRRIDAPAVPSRTTAAIFGIALLVMVFAPWRSDFVKYENEDVGLLKLSKIPYFLDDNLLYLTRTRTLPPPTPVAQAGQPGAVAGIAGFHYLDPDYPFLHTEQTPDVLGPLFNIRPGPPPSLVFIVVEGLGRSFSGPGARLGSFTPHLDRVAEGSLYWENFLAVQGRTFAVLPSLFGSLPFGDEGFAMLGARMPRHDSLLSLLKGQGYRSSFYGGFDSGFDNESQFLKRQGVDLLVDRFNFGAKYPQASAWGYADRELLSRALEGELRAGAQPSVAVIQTVTMHTPYTFPGQAQYAARFEQRLDQLGIAEDRRAPYRAQRDIYTSILYTDDALGRFFEGARKHPAYQNTIFIVVGDHRLPEIPMDTRIERYHVPLIIFSPLLKAPARIKSVSSQFDVTPSLLAFLAHNYGLKTPRAVSWIGSGLDTQPAFRSLHAFPLKQTKTNLVDFVSGSWFINQDKLYSFDDGMALTPTDDDAALSRLQAQFASFRGNNEQFARSLALTPATQGQLIAYRDEDRAKLPASTSGQDAILTVRTVNAPAHSPLGPLTIEAVFANAGAKTSESFVPLVVLMAGNGAEFSESYGPAQRLPPGGSISLLLPVKTLGALPGSYFLSVIASDPATGKRLGQGRYHVPIQFTAAGPVGAAP